MKTLLYPIFVLAFVAFSLFVVLATTRKVGLESQVYKNTNISLNEVEIINVWKDQRVFLISPNGPKNISDSKVPPVEGAVDLKTQGVFGEKVLFLLRFDSGKEDLNEFLHQLSKHSLKQVMITSPNDNTLKNLRSLESNFYYAPSIKNLLKWSLFSRLYIEPIYDLKSDFVYVDEQVKRLLNSQLKKEISRRALPQCEFKEELLCW